MVLQASQNDVISVTVEMRGYCMDERVAKLLDEMRGTVRSANIFKFNKLCVDLEGVLEDEADPLGMVCAVGELAEREGTNRMNVNRRIRRGELRARKSGGIWLIQTPRGIPS